MFVVFAKARNPSDSSKRNEEKKLDFTSDRGLNTGEVGFLHQSPAQRSHQLSPKRSRISRRPTASHGEDAFSGPNYRDDELFLFDDDGYGDF